MTSNYDMAISVRLFFPPFPLSHKVGKMELEAVKKKKQSQGLTACQGKENEARESCYCEGTNAGDSCQVCVFQWS